MQSLQPQIHKLPFAFTEFTLDENNIVHAKLCDDNAVVLSQGPLTKLLEQLPVSRARVKNIKFAEHCIECPDAANMALPLQLKAKFGSGSANRQHLLYLTLEDANGQVVISADTPYIANAIKTRGYPVTSQSIKAVQSVIRGLLPYQRLVGFSRFTTSLPTDFSLYQV